MALTQGTKRWRLGTPSNGSFGYQVAPGEQVWRGSIVALNGAGTLQRVQTAGSVAVVGLAAVDYSNVGNSAASPDYVQVDRGWWNLPLPGTPGAANVNQPVYATDDNTVTFTPPVAGIAGATNTGNGTIGTLSFTTAASIGDYVATFTSATAFSVVSPNGVAVGNGTAGTAFNAGGVAFTVTAGSTAFAAGDSFVVSVGGLELGTLSGWDKGTPYIRILGS